MEFKIENSNLKITDEIFSVNYPVLYILEDEIGNLFLGLNHTRNDAIIVRITKEEILSLLKDKFPIRFYFENKKEYWINKEEGFVKLKTDKTLKNLLPGENDYLEVEFGEFDELVEKYSL